MQPQHIVGGPLHTQRYCTILAYSICMCHASIIIVTHQTRALKCSIPYNGKIWRVFGEYYIWILIWRLRRGYYSTDVGLRPPENFNLEVLNLAINGQIRQIAKLKLLPNFPNKWYCAFILLCVETLKQLSVCKNTVREYRIILHIYIRTVRNYKPICHLHYNYMYAVIYFSKILLKLLCMMGICSQTIMSVLISLSSPPSSWS